MINLLAESSTNTALFWGLIGSMIAVLSIALIIGIYIYFRVQIIKKQVKNDTYKSKNSISSESEKESHEKYISQIDEKFDSSSSTIESELTQSIDLSTKNRTRK